MRFTAAFTAALAATGVVGSNWFSKAAYNSWHETELERWLSDNNVEYPTPADRRDLEKLVESNWNDYAVQPYNKWSVADLNAHLKKKGIEVKDDAAANKDSLLNQVQQSWYETTDKAQEAWSSTSTWLLDTWTDSQLKEFCDRHDIPVPQPRKRDTLLSKARSNFESAAKKAGEAASYPGNWVYQSWAESDLKEWLDIHGFPAPQPSSRDALIASVRRNSRLAYLRAQEQSAKTQASYSKLTDKLIDAWSESDLKEFLDKNGVPVPQGTKPNELRAIVRKHRAEVLGDSVSASAASAFGAATSEAGNQFAKATDSAALIAQEAFDGAIGTWSESRLKGYLDARGVPVPHASKSDELRALVRKHSYKAGSGWTAWTFDDMSYDNLKKYLAKNGDVAAKEIGQKADVTREELVSAANSAYASASSAGGTAFATVTSYLAQSTDEAKKSAFDNWSESDLKAYLDSYGIPVPQGSTANELRAYARRQYTYYKYGTSTPSGTILAKVEDGLKGAFDWAARQFNIGANVATQKAAEAEASLASARAEAAATAKAKASEIRNEL